MNTDIKPSYLYFKNDSNLYECKICHKAFPYNTNAIRHVHIHDVSEDRWSAFTYNGQRILKSTEKILLWKALHGISMLALDDVLMKDLIRDEDCLQSRITNQNIMNEMASQIIELNYRKTGSKTVSLLLDGGTVFHTKWLAVGALLRNDFGISFNVLDVIVFNKSTASAIREDVSRIARNVEKTGGDVVSACTDNAANFKKVFIETDDGEDFIPLNILHVHCACHTVQLVIKDLNDEDKYFRELVKIMKIIPSRISFLKKQQINELGIGFYPPVQSQRWNSVYLTLNYIVNRLSQTMYDLLTLTDLSKTDLYIYY